MVPNVLAAIPGLLASAVLLVSLINGIGHLQAHIESSQFHAASRCGAGARSSDDCIQVVDVTVEGHLGSGSIVVNVPGEGIVPVPIGDTRSLGPARSPQATPTATLFHGQVMDVEYDDEEVISAENPDLFVPTWPILLPFGLILALLTLLVYVVLSWATGYIRLPALRLRRR